MNVEPFLCSHIYIYQITWYHQEAKPPGGSTSVESTRKFSFFFFSLFRAVFVGAFIKEDYSPPYWTALFTLPFPNVDFYVKIPLCKFQ